MDLTSLATIKSILKENNLWVKKRLGQNFLIDRGSLSKLIESAQIKSDDTVVEIGPGLGTITQELMKKAKLVLAVEKDYQLCEWLKKYFKGCKNVKIIHEDILTYNLQLTTNKYKIVSALPYSITSPVIRKFLGNRRQTSDDSCRLDSMHLMVQKEVAQRICAKPGNSERGFLTVLVEFYGEAKIVNYVDRSSFWPTPNVDSAIIKISVNPRFDSKIRVDPLLFFRLVKAGFSQKRRQIHNPLKANLHLTKDQVFDILKKAGIDEKKRAEELTLEEWTKLYKKISNI